MLDLISVSNMRLSDQNTMKKVPSLELMRRAGLILFKSLHWYGNIVILTGKGNNGGDGFALACFLADAGYMPIIYKVFDHTSDDSFFFEMQCKDKGILIRDYIPSLGQLDDADIIVDCLLGTGFKGEVTGQYKECIEEINANDHAYVVSCDINSGINGDTGKSNAYVISDMTLAIAYVKKGLLLASDCFSKLIVGDIGITLDHEEDKFVYAEERSNYQSLEQIESGCVHYCLAEGYSIYLANDDFEIEFLSYK